MTVLTTTNTVSYGGNGVTTVFDFNFLIPAGALVVTVSVNGVSSDSETSAYSVSGLGDANGGSVTFTTAPLTGAVVTLSRQVDLMQPVALVTGGAIYAEVIEGALDRLTMVDQQQGSHLDRALRLPASEEAGTAAVLPAAGSRAGQVLGFDAQGVPSLYSPQSAVSLAASVLMVAANSGVATDVSTILGDSLPWRVASMAALRANRQTASVLAWVEGYARADDGGQGQFWRDTSDTTSADDGGLVVVDASGQRWKRTMGGLHGAPVEWWGAVADGVRLFQASIVAGSATLTASDAAFGAGDVGKLMMVWGAGVGGVPLYTTIASITSPTEVVLADPASTTSSKPACYGTDNSAAFTAALSGYLRVLLGDGVYMLGSPVALPVLSVGGEAVVASIIGRGKMVSRVVSCFAEAAFVIEGTASQIYLGEYAALTIEGQAGVRIGDRTALLLDGSGQAPYLGGNIHDLAVKDYATSGGGNTAASRGIAFDLAKVFNTRVEGCEVSATGYGLVMTGCDINTVRLNRFANCRYGYLWHKSAQTFGNGNLITNNDIVGEGEATCIVYKSTARTDSFVFNKIEVGAGAVGLDWSGMDWPDLFGANADSGPYTVYCIGNTIDLSGAMAYRLNVDAIYSAVVDNPSWASLGTGVFVGADGATVTSVPAVRNGANSTLLTFGDDGAVWGREWAGYRRGAPYAIADEAIMTINGETIRAVWPGWAGNAGVRFRGRALILPTAFSPSASAFFTADWENGVGGETVFVPGKTYTIEITARTTSATGDTLLFGWQEYVGGWVPQALTGVSLNTGFSVYSKTFVARAGSSAPGVLLQRGTSNGDIEILGVVVRAQPANRAYFDVCVTSSAATNITGNGTSATVIFNAVNANSAADYSTATGVFTCRLAGLYQFATHLSLSDITSSFTGGTVSVLVSFASGGSREYRTEFNPYALNNDSDGGRFTVAVSCAPLLAAGDTVAVKLAVWGSTATVDATSNAASIPLCWFSGYRVER